MQHKVLITNAAGIVVDMVDDQEAGDDVEKLKGLLCPGLINAHCHLELSHMKGHIPKHTGLVDFVLKIVTERHYATDDILEAITYAEDMLLQNGIVAVGDICNNALTIPQKNKQRLHYHNFIEASGFIPASADERFERSVSILEAFNGKLSTKKEKRSTIAPHAPYSVSPEIFALINNLPNNNLLTIHNQEMAAENVFFEKGTGDLLRLYQQMGIDVSFFKPTGKTSLQTWLPHFTKEQTIILVHNVYTSAADLLFEKQQTANSKLQTFYCLCPNANIYISNSLPDLQLLMQHTSNIVLGTDSLASNDELSIWAEIKTLQQHYKNLALEDLLKWATSNGAKALQLDKMLGSFEKGKQPGVILINDTGIEKISRII